jgi:predicted PurR-regulated permease PerM
MRPLLIAAGLTIVLAAVKLAAPVLTPLILAITLAIAFHPMSERLARRGIPPWIAAAFTTVAILLAVLSVGALLIRAAADLAVSLPDYVKLFEHTRGDLAAWFAERRLGQTAQAVESFGMGSGRGMLEGFVAGLNGVVQGLVLVVVLTLFLQLEGPRLVRRIVRHTAGPGDAGRGERALSDVQRYLMVKGALSAANGILLGAWCAIWGVDSPLAWGVLAFVLNFVPVIGSVVAAVPPVLLSLASAGMGPAFGVAAGYIAVNLAVDNFMEPKIMGRTSGLSPLAIVLAMAFWGFLLGPVGALLSVPLTGAARLACERVPELEWVAVLVAADGEGSLVRPRG